LDQRGGCEERFDASEKNGEAVGLGDDRRDTEADASDLPRTSPNIVYTTMGREATWSEARRPLDAVHVGHGEIEDNDVGLKSDRFVDGFDTISSFAANFKREWCSRKIRTALRTEISSSTMRMRLGIGEKNIARGFGKGSRVNPVYGICLHVNCI